jgi:hypothetical protein
MSLQAYTPPVFRPYREDKLTPLTLREVLRDEYLRGAIMWLLGYNASRPMAEQINNRPIRAQESECPWHVAWSIICSLDSKHIFLEADKHRELVAEIDRKVLGDGSLQGAVSWLLAAAQAEGEFVHWDSVLYDTAVVTLALLSVRKAYGINRLGAEWEDELKKITNTSVGWLCGQVRDIHSMKTIVSGNESVVLSALLFAERHFHGEFNKLLQKCSEHVGKNVLDFLCDDLLSKEKPSEAIFALDEFYKHTSSESYKKRIRDILPKEVERLEPILSSGQETAGRALRLAEYIRTTGLLDLANKPVKHGDQPDTLANRRIVLQNLYNLTKPSTRFLDGSLYHTLYVTVYATRCYIEVCQRWKEVTRPVLDLYNALLSSATEGARVSEERKQMLALAHDNSILKDILLQNHRRDTWYKTVITFLASIIVVLPIVFFLLSIYGSDPQTFWSAIGVVLAIAGVVDGLVVTSIWQKSPPES